MNEETLFHQALQKPASERAAFLHKACGGDDDLRRRVEVLLQAHDNPGSFLARPALDVTSAEAPCGAGPSPGPAEEGPGTVIGPYQLIQPIGEGGMGTVYLAQQTEPVKRRVALKVIKPGMDSAQVIARFEAERQALALMDHPNIAKVHDAGTTPEGRPFFVMELVKGVPITNYCDQHHLTPRQRLELFMPVCQAIQHAHHKGVIHRDIKPSNVLVALYDDKPVPKVIDFGVAKATGPQLTEQTLHTGFGAVVGTLEYMSPEQAGLNQLDVDTRSDVYSLGVLLYELLSGSPPFRRKDLKQAGMLEMLRLIREQEPSRPSTKLSAAEGLPTLAANRGTEPAKLTRLLRGDLDWIVMKALEKDRNRRYESANGFALDVQRYLADEPVLACPPSMGYRLWKFVRRNKAAVTAVGLFAVLILIGLAVTTALAAWAMRAEGVASALLESEKGERVKAVEAERKRKVQLVHAKLAQARAGRWSRQVGQRFDGLQALTEAATLARELGMDASVFQELRDEAVACLTLPDVHLLKEWEGWSPAYGEGVEFDADLQRYARRHLEGDIEIRQVEGDRLLVQLPGYRHAGKESHATTVRFSPNGGLLVAVYQHPLPARSTNCQVWDLLRKEVVFELPFPVSHHGVAFAPDGRWLAVGQADGTVTVYDIEGRKEVHRLAATPGIASLAFHPDGSRLAVAGQNGTVQVWELATERLLSQVSTSFQACCLAWHPDGDLLAAACHNRIYLGNGSTGQAHAVLQGHQSAVINVSFLTGGDILMSESWDGSSRLWDPWTGRELLRFLGGARQLSRDGRRMASQAGRTLALWEVNPGREYLPLPPRPGTSTGPAVWDISPNGRWLVGGSQCRVWDLARRKEVASLPGARVIAAKFAPNGQDFYTSGQDGLYRWSLESGEGVLRIRLADRLLPPGGWGWLGLDRDGHRIVVAHIGGNSQILDLKKPHGPAHSLEHGVANTAALSPDGCWAATGTHNGFGVRVWDARSGRRVAELLPEARITRVAFSPDDRWLLIATGMEFGFWEVGTWRSIRQIRREGTGMVGAPAAFSPDGKLLAAAVSLTTFCLFDTNTWRPLARLEGPEADLIELVGFTPDGTRLLTASQAGAIRVWDLRRIREQLAEMGLDWDQPPYPPAPPPDDIKPVRVEVDTSGSEQSAKADGFFQEGNKHFQARRLPQAIEAFTRGLELAPNRPDILALRGDAYRMSEQPDKAREDFGRAIELDPDCTHARYCRGLMELGAGNWELAIADLSRFDSARAIRVRAYAALGRWDEALADITPLLDSEPPGGRHLTVAALHLLRGDVKGYQQFCRDRLAQPEQVKKEHSWYPARTAALGADSPIDPRLVVQWAEQALPGGANPGGQHTLGLAYYRAGRFEDAVRACRRSLGTTAPTWEWPGAVTNWPVLALAYHKLDQPANAQEWLAVAAAFLAKVPRGQGDIPHCPATMDLMEWLVFQALYREAKALVPAPAGDVNAAYERWEKANALVKEGAAHAGARRWPQAIEAYTGALKLDPDRVDALVARGNVHRFSGQRDKAKADYIRALQVDREHTSARIDLGILQSGDGEWEQAVKTFPPGKAQAHWAGARGRALAALGQWDEAIEDLTLFESQPLSSVHVIGAALRLLRGDVKGYQQLCRDRLSQPGQVAVGHGLYAYWTAALGADSPIDTRQMIQWAEPRTCPVRYQQLGLAYYRAGRFEDAVRECRRSLDMNATWKWPGAVTNWPVLALAYHKLDRPREARECLAEAAEWLGKAPRGKGDIPICPATMDPMEWLVFQVLYREAKALVPAAEEKK